MREEIIAYLKTQTATLKPVAVSDELPWSKDGEPLYLKNFKRIYVAKESTAQEPLINTLQGASIVNETTSVTAYLTVDAKNPLSNYDEIVNLMKSLKSQISPQEKLDRTVAVTSSIDGDSLEK
jgi:hypothetical protein